MVSQHLRNRRCSSVELVPAAAAKHRVTQVSLDDLSPTPMMVDAFAVVQEQANISTGDLFMLRNFYTQRSSS